MHPTGVASAAWVFASAPSKVPFYVSGGVLAAWAVVLTAGGLTHADFPTSATQARLVMLVSFLLVASTLTAAVLTGGEDEPAAEGRASPPAAPAGGSGTLQLTADPGGQPAYDKTRATVRAGPVDIRLTNRSPVPHNITIAEGGKVVAATGTIESSTATRDADLRPGEYDFYCSVDGHRQAGMKGTLTVR
jgi:plastocyanin